MRLTPEEFESLKDGYRAMRDRQRSQYQTAAQNPEDKPIISDRYELAPETRLLHAPGRP